jgi:hypothetical protein
VNGGKIVPKRRAKTKPTIVPVEFEYEDQLPKFDGSLFSAMYDASVVDGVRLYPFVVINEERFYLVKVPE